MKVINDKKYNLEINLDDVDNATIIGNSATTKFEIKSRGTKTIRLSNSFPEKKF